MTLELSAIVPVFDEAGNIASVIAELDAVLTRMGRSYEIIVVNDGSTDATATEIALAAASHRFCRELALPCHRGQGEALLAGLHAATGRFLLTLDGDGQNDPADLPALLRPVEQGEFDLMCGWRTERAAPRLRRLMSRAANRVRRQLLRDGVHDAGCQLRAMRAEVRSALRPVELMQSFVPALAAAGGFRVGEAPVRDRPRRTGRSKYRATHLAWRPAIAMLRLWRELDAPPPPDLRSRR